MPHNWPATRKNPAQRLMKSVCLLHYNRLMTTVESVYFSCCFLPSFSHCSLSFIASCCIALPCHFRALIYLSNSSRHLEIVIEGLTQGFSASLPGRGPDWLHQPLLRLTHDRSSTVVPGFACMTTARNHRFLLLDR